jgi:hypothetical protein
MIMRGPETFGKPLQIGPGLAVIERFIRTRQVNWVFRDFPFTGLHPTSARRRPH